MVTRPLEHRVREYQNSGALIGAFPPRGKYSRPVLVATAGMIYWIIRHPDGEALLGYNCIQRLCERIVPADKLPAKAEMYCSQHRKE